MKFFFCESCGQRIEQAELDAGRARDKQAKGVFCQACAQAVMTQTFEALQEEQARKLLGGDESAPTPAQRTPKIPAPILVPPAEPRRPRSTTKLRAASEIRARKDSEAPPRRAANAAAAAMLAAGTALLVLAAGILLTRGGRPPEDPREGDATPGEQGETGAAVAQTPAQLEEVHASTALTRLLKTDGRTTGWTACIETGMELKQGERTYPNSLEIWPARAESLPVLAAFDLGGRYTTLSFHYGQPGSGSAPGGGFQFASGSRTLWESDPIVRRGQFKAARIDVRGVKTLLLRSYVKAGEDGIGIQLLSPEVHLAEAQGTETSGTLYLDTLEPVFFKKELENPVLHDARAAIKGVAYERGVSFPLKLKVEGYATYFLHGEYKSFRAMAGYTKPGLNATVRFMVQTNPAKRRVEFTLKPGDEGPIPIDLDVQGERSVRISVFVISEDSAPKEEIRGAFFDARVIP